MDFCTHFFDIIVYLDIIFIQSFKTRLKSFLEIRISAHFMVLALDLTFMVIRMITNSLFLWKFPEKI